MEKEKYARPVLVIVVGIIILSQLAGLLVDRIKGLPVVVAGSPPTCNIPAIYNFGDSNSDTGGISAAFYAMVPPYGKTFFNGHAGRASDGRLIIDFIAEHLGLPYLSAYLDSIKTNFSHGANFATGGATISRMNESWFENNISPFPLDIQIAQFHQFKERTTFFYNQASDPRERSDLPRPEDFAKALYTLDIGQNDITAGFRKLGIEETRSILPDVVKQFSDSVNLLYLNGARAFWVHNLGPVGCLPINGKFRNKILLDEIGCAKGPNDIAIDFNKQLKEAILKLRELLPNAAITYVDMYAAKFQLFSTAKDQGFNDRFSICCGHHDANNDIWCGSKGEINGTELFAGPCKDPSKVISWDGVHYTEAANKWIANLIFNGSFSDPPVSVTQTCPNTIL